MKNVRTLTFFCLNLRDLNQNSENHIFHVAQNLLCIFQKGPLSNSFNTNIALLSLCVAEIKYNYITSHEWLSNIQKSSYK